MTRLFGIVFQLTLCNTVRCCQSHVKMKSLLTVLSCLDTRFIYLVFLLKRDCFWSSKSALMKILTTLAMLLSQVSGPMLRCTTLSTVFQQIKLSLNDPTTCLNCSSVLQNWSINFKVIFLHQKQSSWISFWLMQTNLLFKVQRQQSKINCTKLSIKKSELRLKRPKQMKMEPKLGRMSFKQIMTKTVKITLNSFWQRI